MSVLVSSRNPVRSLWEAAVMAASGKDSAGPKAGQRVSYPSRMTLDLTEDDIHAPQGAREADRIIKADRVLAMISVRSQGPALTGAVSTRAREPLQASMTSPE